MTQPLIFGEVLFDHFPDGSVVQGGAPFNVAWNLAAFGLEPLLVSRVGDDPLGRQVRDRMRGWGLCTAGLQLDSAHPTGAVEVTLTQGEPSFAILPDQAYDFIDATALPPLSGIDLIYHGTLAARDPVSRRALHSLRGDLDAPVFVDVNLRAPWWRRDETLALLAGATWAKLNQDELEALAPAGASLERRAEALRAELGLEALFLTRGAAGALAFTRDAGCIPAAPVAQPAPQDTVGAGDAFAACLIAGLLRGRPLVETLQRAQAFASRVVGLRGATVADRAFYA